MINVRWDGILEVESEVNPGNSFKSSENLQSGAIKGREGKRDETLVPVIAILVRDRWLYLCVDRWADWNCVKVCANDSTPVSIMMNGQVNERRRPRLTVMFLDPYVFICVLLAAYSFTSDGLALLCTRRGMMDTSEPESIRNFISVAGSIITNRWLVTTREKLFLLCTVWWQWNDSCCHYWCGWLFSAMRVGVGVW